ncbi:MAG TPA: MarR family transcriptional regulator [Thermomicrobiales bacterium]|nr:MarR family transcriptional regulator [Thermomicrobiales bacterium]
MEASSPTSLLSALRAAYRAARLEYRDRLAPLDLTARQAAVIRALAARPGLGLGAIAEAVGADQPTASALVDRLVERGLVARAADPSDRRRTCLRLTPAAETLAEAVQHERAAMDARLVDALGAARAAQLLALLGELTVRLGDDARDGEGDD